jgi:large subunit ribosomal protein L9
MFGTISPKQIEGELKTKYNIVIDKRKFIDHYPVNAIGYTRLRIELYKDVIGVVNVHVSEEQ